jgi:hypothetical protein
MQRPAARPAAPAPRVAPRPTTLTADEEARAAELEAAIVSQEQAAAAIRRGRSPRPSVDAQTRSFSTLAVAAGNEYAYVARDVRRIATVGGTLIGVLVALWAVVQVTHITL